MNHLTTQLEKTVGKHLTNLIFGTLPFVVLFAGNAVYEPIADMSGISTQATAQAVLALVAVAGVLAIWRILTLFPKSGEVFNPAQASEQLDNAWVKIVEEQLSNNRALLDFYAPKADYREQYKEQAADEVDQARKAEVRQNIVGAVRLPVEGDDETTLTIQERFARSKTLPKAFTITLRTNGEAERRVEAFADNIKSSLNLYSVEVDRDSNPFGSLVNFICHTEKIEVPDFLFESRFGGEFFEENPCLRPTLIPLAVSSTKQTWSLPLHHTLIAGLTGAGKGSVIQGIVRQLTPFIIKGEVVLFGADPKNAELKSYRNSFLFERLAFDTDDIMSVIEEVWQRMKTRQQFTGREVEYSAQIPVIILMIDEFSSVLKDADKDTKAKLYQILAQGRSDLIFVVAATQNLDKAILGDIRDNFANKIALRLESPYFIDIALGAGSYDKGARADLIPIGSKENGYASAGLAYAKDEAGNISYVRFAYTSSKELDELVEATSFDTDEPKAVMPEVI